MNNKKELTTEHYFDSPLELIWKAWTDPEMLKRWWGPDNVLISECSVDLRVGGKFHVVMEAGEAMGQYKDTRWLMLAEFTEVVPNYKLSFRAKAWTEGYKEDTMIDQTTEVFFSEEGDRSKVKVSVKVNEAGPKAGMAVEGVEHGFTQQLNKLHYLLSIKD